MSDYPKLLQIEPTNQCNFSCSMCLNAYGNSENYYLSLEKFRNIAEETFPNLEKLVLYGFGEPLMHPDFMEMLRISRKFLPLEGTISFTTNGSLLDNKKIEVLIDRHLVDEIVFSCDMLLDNDLHPELHTLDNRNVEVNLRYLIEKNSEKKIRIGIQTVLMRSNVDQIEDIITKFGSMGIDFLSISHVYPFYNNLRDELLFTMISKEALSILEENQTEWKEIVLGVSKEKFAEKMQETYKQMYQNKTNILTKERPYSKVFTEAQSKAKEMGISLNFSLYVSDKERIKELDKLKKLFEKFKTVANEKGVELVLPAIISEFSERECPYHAAHASVIRSDGGVVPCFKYLWDHESFLNYHERINSSFSFGNIFQNSFQEIWESDQYLKFRSKMGNMNKFIPYCGDCSLSSNNCFYAIEDTSDCWGNVPFCSECPYSLNLTKCIM